MWIAECTHCAWTSGNLLTDVVADALAALHMGNHREHRTTLRQIREQPIAQDLALQGCRWEFLYSWPWGKTTTRQHCAVAPEVPEGGTP